MFLKSWKYIVSFIILHYIGKVTLDLKEVVLANRNTAPLALLPKNGDLMLAKPYRYILQENLSRTTFLHDNTDETNYLALACPPYTENQIKQQNEWNTREASDSKGIEEVILFSGNKIDCEKEIVPTISQHNHSENCHRSNGEMKGVTYGVGYLVWNPYKNLIDFVSIYNFCYTKEDGTLYTLHRILSPHLLKIRNDYTTDIVYHSFLDVNNGNRGSKKWWEDFGNNFVKYQLVDYLDMAGYSWKMATFFSFNYIPLAEKRTKKYLHKINNYIRYFAKMKNVELTVYSGTYTYTISKETWDIIYEGKKYAPVPDHFVWKLIHDDEYNSVFIITHLRPFKNCNIRCAYTPVTIDKSKDGCTYTCQVDPHLLSNLGLENFESKGYLIFDLPATPATATSDEIQKDGGSEDSKNRPNTVNISSFLKTHYDFQSAVSAYEAGEPILPL